MPKEVLSIRLDKEDIDLIKKLADLHVRPVGSELAFLIRQAAQNEGLMNKG